MLGGRRGDGEGDAEMDAYARDRCWVVACLLGLMMMMMMMSVRSLDGAG